MKITHPLNRPEIIRFALGVSISSALEESGKFHLLVSVPADSTVPEALRGRRIMLALECSKETADACYGVAKGTHRAVRIRTPKT
jgi:hypothetical protein